MQRPRTSSVAVLGEAAPEALAPDHDRTLLCADHDLLVQVVQGSPVGVVVTTLADGRVLDANASLLRLIGYTRDEFVGQSTLALGIWVDPARREEMVAALRERRPGREFEAQIRTREGAIRVVAVTAEAVDIDGVACAVIQVYDLTRLRRSEAAAQSAEARYQALVEQIPAMTYTESLGDTDTYTYVSPQIETLFGYAAEDVVGHPGAVTDKIHPDDREAVHQEGARTSATGEPFQMEYRVRAADGRWVWVRNEAALVRDETGQPLHWQGVVVDVTDQRGAERALRESERRSHAFIDAALDCVIAMDGEWRITEFNPAAERTFGYRRDDAVGLPLAELIVPPQMQAGHQADFQWHLAAGKGSLAGQRVETTAMRADGSHFPVELAVMPVAGADGQWFVGYLRDISGRLAMEAALRDSEERFRSLVQNSYDVINVVDADGVRRYISPAVTRALDYAPEELLGRSILDLVHPDDAPAVQQAIAACLRGERQTPALELRYRHRDGTWRDFETVGTNLLDEPSVRGIVFNARCITARKAAGAALRESEERFRSAFDHAPIGMALVALDGTFLQVNHALCGIVGYSPHELRAMTLAGITHPDDLETDAEFRDQLLRGDIITYQLEKHFLCEEDCLICGRLTVALVRDPDGAPRAFVVQLQDITPFKAAGAALRESEERFRSAFDHAPIGLALVAPDGRFRQVNRSLCEIVGYSEQALLATTFADITHPDDLADDLALTERVRRGELDTYHLETRVLHRDGPEVWVHLTVSAVRDPAGALRYCIAQVQDVTDRRRLDLERASMLANEREYAKQLRALTDMRADLTAMVAHELRSPLAALRITASMLATGALAPEQEAEALTVVQAEVSRLDRLVTDVAAAAAAERDDFSIQFHPVPLALLVDAAATFARASLGDRPFTIATFPDARVWCDPERISQVLRNLLDNIAKHTPPGTPVTLRAHRDRRRIRLEIADRGPGIPVEDLPLIFEKFGRGRDAVDSQCPGAGIGLYLSRQILQAHGTDLSVASAPGEGAAFAFELRVAS
jgi:PAS domain S-box-containing protein